LRTNRLAFLAAVPVLFILLIVAFLAWRFAADERSEQGWVLHTYQVMDQIRKIFSDVQDAETGERGYLLTRQDSFLQPYRHAVAAVGNDIAAFRQLTGDNPAQQRRADQLRRLMENRLTALDRGRALVLGAGPSPSPQLLDEMHVGQSRMEAFRHAVGTALSEEKRLLHQRLSDRHAAESREIAAALVAAAIAFLVLLAAAILLVLSNVRLARTEADRERRARLLQTTLDSIRDGVAVFDAEGKLVAFNSNFFGCMGYPSELAVRGTPIERFSILASERKQPAFADLPFVTGGYGAGYRDITFDNRHIEIYRSHVQDGGFLVACLDVTQRVQSETALRQAQKMETIGHLTGGVAHDFNNLLQIIGANLDLMARDMEPATRAADRLQNAMSAVERGARLTAQLLAFARRQALAPRVTSLAGLLREMTDLLARTLGERVELESVIAGGLWNTLVDPGQLENAILNLAINARDAMPEGGKLTIELANAFLDEAYAKEHAEVAAGQYVMVAISDTGHGMPQEVMARAFEPFYTTKPEGQGTGLGLSQVYGFVKQSGGHVKIYSEIDNGTTVKLYLPRSKATAPQWASAALVEPAQGGNETVLVVEDDEGVRAAVTDMLTDLGYSVLRAENAEQAVALLKEGHHVDVLFTDVVMPGRKTTRDLARTARELLPEVKVLFTSGYTQNAIVHNGRLDEGIELLSKPYRKDDLARKLRDMLGETKEKAATSTPGAAPAQYSTPADSGLEPVHGPKVLIVEDSAVIRMTTVDMVMELGLSCAEAASGPEAVAILKDDPQIGILLTDLGLSGMSGAQLIGEARKLKPEIMVVAASGYSEESIAGGALKDVAYLQKPFTLEQLRAVLITG
jgi:signal transduction histidine kinase/DNA-binding response OmpR family regulator/CHASE3 domain sensor protein